MKRRLGSHLVTIMTDPAGPRNEAWVAHTVADLADYVHAYMRREPHDNTATAKAFQRWFECARQQARQRGETLPVITECQVDLYTKHGQRGDHIASMDVLKGTLSEFAASEG